VQVSRLGIASLVFAAVVAISAQAGALQCVPFAREVSGISIRGDAWTWWSAAVGQYDRGQAPRIGAVVVFKKHGAMRYGHVAVVTRVINNREVLVDHANWAPHRGRGRGQIAKMVAVTDISPRNDWTEVRVWNLATRDYGTRVYPTYGFVYPKSGDARLQEAALRIETPSRMVVARPQHPPAPQLATVDLQIAKALAAAAVPAPTPVPAPVPVTVQAVAPVPAPAPAPVVAVVAAPAPLPVVVQPPPPPPAAPVTLASLSAEEDLALARRFGAGRY